MTAAAGARRTFAPVRRNSYDVDDPRAQVFRPIEGGIKFVDVFLEVFDEWANQVKRKGAQHELNSNCRKVLATLLRCADFRTGICEPSIDKLMEKTRFARATVVRALKVLSENHFVNWVRRTIKTDNAPGDGPQVKQVSNAYFLDLGRLNKRIRMAIQQKLRKKKVAVQVPDEPRRPIFAERRMRRATSNRQRFEDRAYRLQAAASPEEKAAILYPDSPEDAAEWVAMMREGASSETSLNPPSSIKENKE